MLFNIISNKIRKIFLQNRKKLINETSEFYKVTELHELNELIFLKRAIEVNLIRYPYSWLTDYIISEA